MVTVESTVWLFDQDVAMSHEFSGELWPDRPLVLINSDVYLERVGAHCGQYVEV